MDDINIPRIKPSEEIEINNNPEEEGGSIQIPKINIGKTRAWKIKIGKRGKYALLVFGVILFIYGLLTYRLYAKAIKVKASLDGIREAISSQNFDAIKENLGKTEDTLLELGSAYKPFTVFKIIPFVGAYVSDGQHGIIAASYGVETASLLVEVTEPYADIIGFTSGSKQSTSGEQTAQERLDFVVKTIPDLISKADALTEKVKLVRSEIGTIDPTRYPVTVFGKPVREKLRGGLELVDTSSELLENGKPLLEAAPYLLGVDKERTYLVIFQNDKELRPTGGFITAYSIAKVTKGRFEPVKSDDIYNLDDQYKPKVSAPEPLIKYIKGPYTLSRNYRLRDMNWLPDFKASMDLFVREIESVGIDDIDGIIAVDTQVLVNILNATGPIQVPGFGEYSTKIVAECDCPQVIYELESFADIEGPIVWSENEPGKIVYAPPNYDNRKKIIGPLMNSVLANALGQPKEKLPMLFEAILKSLTEKHVLFYMHDAKSQDAVEVFGIAGTLDEYNGDYIHINDANLGGRKSNLYVMQEVVQEIEVAKDGTATKTVTITYKNPKEHDGWLNSVLPNWVRIYVPKGSELIEFNGVEEKQEVYEEFGKTVFAGFFNLRPQGVAKITLKYKLPFKIEKHYNIFLQKQPGTDSPLYTVQFKKQKEEFFLKVDREIKFKI
ncbi:hypothetical protein A2715_05195 [Candidatus Woesebacteria bacterium RIFCSPHIGHO2_01_FULL_39_32]|uniref:DUF4012 domain-containing protein n=1 Tax=Candidatus Woesebacteria bacterium RIFCSPLOWO2_01_FULL_39_25 TaxID=1802521 RepID=A0A1F8BNK9_9BACT|nr:MAG: hypothetical protein A2124_01335 [Candidatus Woesebacteria bacterium GWB1_37_5]OGM25414.1 MAG: hypothetical protein A2715_05195 [Candidatus Woesebacteria bacterium RIFCSPHIGHO2_01_FULL_39_32]OGM38519.1 MAG: hypothetical protein A3F01_04155 [Candidatus Woesebacteria bacterium RIFCSPHIGHO2_12_FULL_38_11]OGM64945.1 MAG: hypothetical protein A2893_04805 [Candidatus Woesebacteria bacterium RIFCSPLOWO2_01_FULL_39_25]